MLTLPAQVRIALDDLASELLPAAVVTAISLVTVERWRSAAMKDPYREHPATRTPALEHRVLPVVVLGQIVIMPYRPPVPLVISIGDGASYRAIKAAIRGDGEVLIVFMPEAELEGFRSDVAQALPNVGVIARVAELQAHDDAYHRIEVEGLSRAAIVQRVAHVPFYRARCIPQVEPEPDASRQAELQQVKAWVETYARSSDPHMAAIWLPFINRIRQPGPLADVLASSPLFTFPEQLALLQTLDPHERMQAVRRKLAI